MVNPASVRLLLLNVLQVRLLERIFLYSSCMYSHELLREQISTYGVSGLHVEFAAGVLISGSSLEYTQRPLFQVTCGDLGSSAEVVERTLENHFQLAHKWGCVLLLDEAESVFRSIIRLLAESITVCSSWRGASRTSNGTRS